MSAISHWQYICLYFDKGTIYINTYVVTSSYFPSSNIFFLTPPKKGWKWEGQKVQFFVDDFSLMYILHFQDVFQSHGTSVGL